VLNTASAVLGFAKELEDKIVRFYEDAAHNEKYSVAKSTFLAFITESKKNKAMVERVYREIITDAIEACYSFPALNSGNYSAEIELTENMGYPDVLKMAMEFEEKSRKFYVDSAESSKSLLADISVAFKKIGQKKAGRLLKLKSLYEASRTQ